MNIFITGAETVSQATDIASLTRYAAILNFLQFELSALAAANGPLTIATDPTTSFGIFFDGSGEPAQPPGSTVVQQTFATVGVTFHPDLIYNFNGGLNPVALTLSALQSLQLLGTPWRDVNQAQCPTPALVFLNPQPPVHGVPSVVASGTGTPFLGVVQGYAKTPGAFQAQINGGAWATAPIFPSVSSIAFNVHINTVALAGTTATIGLRDTTNTAVTASMQVTFT